jgi:putative ABC transport system permease protein
MSTTQDIEREIDQQMAALFVFIGVLLSFGSLLAGSAIHSVASVSLLERTRELATLRSLGFTAKFAAWLAGPELCFLALVGLVTGIPLGVLVHTLFMRTGRR